MSRFFISYRRDDGSGYAGRIYDHLVQNFGEGHVFMDVDAIEPGQDFVEVIQDAVSSCSALIAVIGRNWSGLRPDGSRRIEDPEDFVHLEVATALERGVRVIPVLVDDAEAPKSTELPPPLQALARRQAVRAPHASFRAEIDRLVRTLAKIEAPAAAGSPVSPPVATASPKPSPRPAEVARVSRLDISEGFYEEIYLSPDGHDLYLTRLREKINFSDQYDLLHCDLVEGGLTLIANVGVDGSYFAKFQGGLFYKTQSVKEYETHKILCFRRQESVSGPIEKLIIQGLSGTLGSDSLILKIQDHFYRLILGVDYHVKLDLGEAAESVVWSHPNKPLLLVKFRKPNDVGQEDDRLYEYRLIEFDSLCAVKFSRRVLIEDSARRYYGFTSWTDDMLLFEEGFDSNGDGKVDNADDHNEIVHALDLRTGEISPVLSEPASYTGLGGHPSGRYVYFLEEIAESEKYILRLFDAKTLRSEDLAVLGGGIYYCMFDKACRLAICERILDSDNEDKEIFDWRCRRLIYRIDLPNLD
jgi:hypothetical protein